MTETPRPSGFKGEYLWELEIVEWQLNALAAALPAERYRWKPDETARTVSQILVHIAAGNLLLLNYVGHPAPDDLYGMVPDGPQRFWGLVHRNEELENSVTDKGAVDALLHRSFTAVTNAFRDTSDAELERVGDFFGEQTTVRRVFLRVLAHSHEHMGQLIAYVRAMGLPAPWPDPRRAAPV